MNFLIITTQSVHVTNNDLSKISSMPSIYAYFFKKYLEVNGYNVQCKEYSYINEHMENYNNCFLTFNRGLKYLKPDEYEILRSKISNKIITICETSKEVGNEDILLFFVGKKKHRTLKINWMADPTILYPQKDPDRITVLVDHMYYGNIDSRIYKTDKSKITIESLLEYRKISTKPIDIYFIASGGVILINSLSEMKGFKQSQSMNYNDIVKYYNKCDIFVNTHYESMGLTNLECAMAGALIVTFDDFLKNEFVSQIHHHKVIGTDINWDQIIDKINVNKSLHMVKNCTYENAVNTLIKHIV